MKRAKREIRRPKPHLGRVFRDVRRKLEGRPEVAAQFAEPLARVARLLAQQRTDKHKLYALHAPEVACIAKGKAHNRYEFGAKLSVAVTNREGVVVGMQTHPAIPTTARPLRPCSPRSNGSPGSRPNAVTWTAAVAAMG
jgi:transposase, IS5 family